MPTASARLPAARGAPLAAQVLPSINAGVCAVEWSQGRRVLTLRSDTSVASNCVTSRNTRPTPTAGTVTLEVLLLLTMALCCLLLSLALVCCWYLAGGVVRACTALPRSVLRAAVIGRVRADHNVSALALSKLPPRESVSICIPEISHGCNVMSTPQWEISLCLSVSVPLSPFHSVRLGIYMNNKCANVFMCIYISIYKYICICIYMYYI